MNKQQYLTEIGVGTNSRRTSMCARIRFAAPQLRNWIFSLDQIPRSCRMDLLSGQYAKTPAIIASAGPSLEADLPALKAARGKALIFAVDSIHDMLLASGIRPHITCTIDQQAIAMRKFAAPHYDGNLFYAPGAHPYNIRRFSQPFLGFYRDDFNAGVALWLGLNFNSYLSTTAVSQFALQQAVLLGCRPIYLVGCDLAVTPSRSHVSGVAHWANDAELKSRYHLTAPANRTSGKVMTDEIFNFQAESYEEFVRSQRKVRPKSRIALINCSGGRKIEGAEYRPLAEMVGGMRGLEIDVEIELAKRAAAQSQIAIPSTFGGRMLDPILTAANLEAGWQHVNGQTPDLRAENAWVKTAIASDLADAKANRG
ncbi:MAG TPA: 6-hydroxymethylpterin diphosphokinase MptE-like protein, partial [Hyphomicrobiaceae bacterium]|nr:6-hydroxymethylpterin diphosphokinase MptE-like protein [Hyphomicrobiaceae bacterium]